MKRDLAIRALNNAVALRQPPKGYIHHTDRGSQYCSNDYQKLLTKRGFEVSMSGKGIATPLGIMLRITLQGSG
jgi:putative transposase